MLVAADTTDCYTLCACMLGVNFSSNVIYVMIFGNQLKTEMMNQVNPQSSLHPVLFHQLTLQQWINLCMSLLTLHQMLVNAKLQVD